MSKAHHGILWDNKSSLPFGSHYLREPSALQLRGYLTMGLFLGHTDTSKALCIDCGKLLSLGSNKPGKQTVDGLKCATKISIYTLYIRKVESRQQGPPAKKGETGSVVIVRPWSRDLSALEFILSRSWSRSRDLKSKVSVLVSRPDGQGLGLETWRPRSRSWSRDLKKVSTTTLETGRGICGAL